MKKLYLIVCVVLCGCSSQDHTSQTSVVRVEAASVEEKEISIYVTAIGNAIEHSIVQVRPQVQGILLNAYVKQGQDIKKGTLLYEIDPSLYQAALDEAVGTLNKNKAALEIAKIVVQRNKELVEKNYIPKLTYEQYQTNVKTAEADVTIAQAEVAKAQINLGFCRITSPINGKISAFNIFPGTLVLANDQQAITEIREIDPIDIQFGVPQSVFQRIQEVQQNWPLPFEAALPQDPQTKFTGKINFIDNHLDLNTGTILLKATLENKERKLWPGEFVTVRIFLRKEPHAILIPTTSIQTGSKGQFVYVIHPDMTVKAVFIKTGEVIDNNIAVLSGLKIGDKVVTNGQNNLKNNAKVEIIEKGNNK